jgi:hypothetical protein
MTIVFQVLELYVPFHSTFDIGNPYLQLAKGARLQSFVPTDMTMAAHRYTGKRCAPLAVHDYPVQLA